MQTGVVIPSDLTGILEETQELFAYTQFLRRDFHRHPELGFMEFRTAGIVARELNALGLEVTTGIGKTGVVALLEGEKPGPTVMLRFDMDALPIQEETGAEYASENPGVMHACGHDAHTAIGLTVARILSDRKERLAGTVKFVFQPAEEALGGAEGMIADGVLENPKPDMVLGMHLWNEKPLGWFGIAPGAVMASSDIFTVQVVGKGGHGAIPHLAVDPIVAASQIVVSTQSIVARNVAPSQAVVVSITSIHGGDAFNVIPPRVELKGTIRTFDKVAREKVVNRFEEIIQNTASAMGCHAEIDLKPLTPALVNDPAVTEKVLDVANRLWAGDEISSQFNTMGSEDMAFFLDKVPGCFFFVGSANHEQGFDAPHHHPRFDVDEHALVKGASLLAATVEEVLIQDAQRKW